jgi:ABC-type transporter Mla MlaB component
MTTNNLIGYDPLAWMEGEEVVEEIPAEPVKKATKSRAKTKPAPVEEVIEETAIATVEETPEELPVAEIVAEDEDVEIDVSIDENGEIEITVDADENVDVEIDVEMDDVEPETAETDEMLDALVEEARDISEAENAPEIAEESVPEVKEMPEVVEAVEPLIELGTEASLKTIAELYEHCKRVLAAHDVIEINAADIATIDTATLQLLVSLKKDAPLSNKTITIIYPSARFIESARLLDLLTILEVTE